MSLICYTDDTLFSQGVQRVTTKATTLDVVNGLSLVIKIQIGQHNDFALKTDLHNTNISQ